MKQFVKDKKYAPIGVFDSGVGGLTVAREIMRQLPMESMIYFGDTARVPYGNKSKETIVRYSRQIMHFLESKGVKAIVVACNTASAFALEELQPELEIPMIGVVKSGAKVAAQTTKIGKIGVIGTEGTIGSQIYTKMIRETNPQAEVLGKACPLFVPLVEEGWLKDSITMEVAKRYLTSFRESNIDTLILGCTHYPLLRAIIGEVMGQQVTLVNPAYETAHGLKQLLEQYELQNDGMEGKGKYPSDSFEDIESYEMQEQGRYQFYVSDAAEKFKDFANSILPCEIEEARLIHIEE
ncbi:MAG: glutamate racemase [Lachnospiraceae bacterium]